MGNILPKYERMLFMKLFLKIVLSVVIIFALISAGGVFYLTRGLEKGSQLAISNVDLSSISDGIYNGSYDSGRWTNKVAVTVKNHKIEAIKLIDDVMVPQAELEDKLFNKVIQTQSVNIDVVSGATVTSKAYLKSIENALKK
jgi:uncharacterized protein with FMN-binding domain